MREWIIALGLLVLLAVLLDGLRRMRNARRDSLQMSLNMNGGIDREGLDAYGHEFPSGGARVRTRRPEDEPVFDDDTSIAWADTVRRRASDLALDQAVPVLMDMNDESALPEDFLDDEELPEYGHEHESLDIEGDDPDSRALHGYQRTTGLQEEREPVGAAAEGVIGRPRVYERPPDRLPPRREAPVIKECRPVIQVQQERAEREREARRQQELAQQRQETERQQREAARAAAQQRDSAPRQLAFQEVLVISVMAREPGGFRGDELLETVLSAGMRYGHHNIFHHYIGEDREDDSLYSLVNIVKPGTFDLNAMDSFTTPGVSLFLELPAPVKSMEAFESMLATARAIADALNGELRDENRSVMTMQTIEHCRQRIRDFEMQSRLRAR